MTIPTKLTLSLLSIFAATYAHAVLWFGVDSTSVPVYETDLEGFPTVTFNGLETGHSVWGAAYSPDARLMYFCDFSNLYSFDPATGLFATIAPLTLNGNAVNMVGLAYGRGKLIGFRNVGTQGFYEINPVTGAATLLWNTVGFDFGGIDYDNLTDKFYGLNDIAVGGSTTRGLYMLDLTLQQATFMANYPAGETDLDGLACYGGKAYLVDDDNVHGASLTGGLFYRYDLTVGGSGSYQSFNCPFTNANTFSGAAFIPESLAPVISGSISYQNYAGTFTDFVLDFIDQNGNIVESKVVPIGTGGTYSVTGPAVPGTYTLSTKRSHWLRKSSSPINTGVSTSGINFVLTNGDVDGDNEVGPADFSLLSGAFGSSLGDPGFLENADLDGDEEVGPSDFSILSASFGQQGD